MANPQFDIKSLMSGSTAAQTVVTVQPSITPEQNLEMNKKLAEKIEARVYGIGDTVLNDPSIALYEAKGFKVEMRVMPSTKGDIYYNLVAYDMEAAEGEKNEVTRLQVGKVANGTTSVDNRFSMFIAQLRKDMNDYVMEKRMNYWGRAEKKRSARQDLSQLSLAA